MKEVSLVIPDGLLNDGESLEWRMAKAGEDVLEDGTRQTAHKSRCYLDLVVVKT